MQIYINFPLHQLKIFKFVIHVYFVSSFKLWVQFQGNVFFAGNIRVVDPVREFGSPGLGNVAWKERVDGWKMKQEKNVVPMTTSNAASERGGDIDASTDVLVDDSLLWVPTWVWFINLLCSLGIRAWFICVVSLSIKNKFTLHTTWAHPLGQFQVPLACHPSTTTRNKLWCHWCWVSLFAFLYTSTLRNSFRGCKKVIDFFSFKNDDESIY